MQMRKLGVTSQDDTRIRGEISQRIAELRLLDKRKP
jgi:hypothetical protein